MFHSTLTLHDVKSVTLETAHIPGCDVPRTRIVLTGADGERFDLVVFHHPKGCDVPLMIET